MDFNNFIRLKKNTNYVIRLKTREYHKRFINPAKTLKQAIFSFKQFCTAGRLPGGTQAVV